MFEAKCLGRQLYGKGYGSFHLSGEYRGLSGSRDLPCEESTFWSPVQHKVPWEDAFAEVKLEKSKALESQHDAEPMRLRACLRAGSPWQLGGLGRQITRVPLISNGLSAFFLMTLRALGPLPPSPDLWLNGSFSAGLWGPDLAEAGAAQWEPQPWTE